MKRFMQDDGYGGIVTMEMLMDGSMRIITDDDDHWVDPRRTNSKMSHPYNYSEFFIWKKGDVKAAGVEAVYHDRMQQWDYDKYKKSFAIASEDHPDSMSGIPSMKQKQASLFMSTYQEMNCEVIAIAEGCNASNGYPYWIFWYIVKEIEENTDDETMEETIERIESILENSMDEILSTPMDETPEENLSASMEKELNEFLENVIK